MSEQTLYIPHQAPNLNDLIRLKAESAAYRERRKAIELIRRTGRGRKRQPRDRYGALKAQWATIVLAYVREQRIKPVGAAHVEFTIIETDRRRDPDNVCSASAKFLLDGLVKCGVLKTDGWAGVLSLSFAWELGMAPGIRVTLRTEEEAA